MPRFAPSTHLETHEVQNQPPEFAGRNAYATDPVLRAAVKREGGDWVDEAALELGAQVGSESVLELGEQANRYPPELITFDRYGRRIDEVRYHPAYHRLMTLGMEHRVHDIAWTCEREGGHVAHVTLLTLMSQADCGVGCPLNMTYASVPSLRVQPDVTTPWLHAVLGGRYDPLLAPFATKRGATIGMAMTEKQGGSDVRANSTVARPIAGPSHRSYQLRGHKWFCSAPMSDAFLTLAQTEHGLSCFLVPRITPDGERNGMQLMRLKDKLGNRSNASAEIEYHDAFAELLGEPGRGVNVIIDMVHHTRLGTIAGTLGIMRMALAQALHHVSHRSAFGRRLIDHALMRAVIADLALEYEAAVCLTLRIARAFDASSGDVQGRSFARLAVAIAKYYLTKRTSNFVYECMECLGGQGYVEESPLPRLFREAPLNAIWEGSGNVIALDVLRTIHREPAALDSYMSELAHARGSNALLDARVSELQQRLSHGAPPDEAEARWLAERMALLLQSSLLVRHAPAAISDAFCATRLAGQHGRTFGSFPSGLTVDASAIIERQQA